MAKRGPYSLVVSPAAQKDLRKLPPSLEERIQRLLVALKEEPRPAGCRKVQEQPSTYRIRVGQYRVIYDVFDNRRLIEVLRVLRRSETTYRRLR